MTLRGFSQGLTAETVLIRSDDGLEDFYADNNIQEWLDDEPTMDNVVDARLAMQLLTRIDPAATDMANSETAMDVVVASETAMDGVAASETAMDAVGASETARDAVRDSDLAFDTVAGVNMAIGKFAAGDAGLDPTEYADMDAVAASETAMDAVAASETAMDAVAASTPARSAVLGSSVAADAVWSSELASERIWEEGDTFFRSGAEEDADVNFVQDFDDTARNLEIHVDSQDNTEGEDGWSLVLDFSNYSQLKVQTEFEPISETGREDRFPLRVKVDGDELLSVEPHTRTDRDLDVSTYDGEQELKLVSEVLNAIDDEWKHKFGELQFE